MSEKKITIKGNSYWGSNGAYQEEYDKLSDELVPQSGEADTVHGELMRASGNLFYEFCNNGNCNAVDSIMETCHSCGGDGYQDEEEDEDGYREDCHYCGGECRNVVGGEVTKKYAEHLAFIKKELPSAPIDELKQFMIDEYTNISFGDDEMKLYNDVMDEVMYHVVNTENIKRIVKTNA
jgi:hypothetical protein